MILKVSAGPAAPHGAKHSRIRARMAAQRRQRYTPQTSRAQKRNIEVRRDTNFRGNICAITTYKKNNKHEIKRKKEIYHYVVMKSQGDRQYLRLADLHDERHRGCVSERKSYT